jgi:hypothetical protein
MIEHAGAVSVKAVATGGIGVALMAIFNDTEVMFLIVTGIFASLSSYFYDWVHRYPRSFGLKEISEALKYSFYGLSVIFIIYYLGKNNGHSYIDLPSSAWGFIAALCAGSAVQLVEWAKEVLNKFIIKKAGL